MHSDVPADFFQEHVGRVCIYGCLVARDFARQPTLCEEMQLYPPQVSAHLGVQECSRMPSMCALGVGILASLRTKLVGGQSHLCLHRRHSPWLPSIIYFHGRGEPPGNHTCKLAVPHPTPDAGPFYDAVSCGDGDARALKSRSARGGHNLPASRCWVPWLRLYFPLHESSMMHV